MAFQMVEPFTCKFIILLLFTLLITTFCSRKHPKVNYYSEDIDGIIEQKLIRKTIKLGI